MSSLPTMANAAEKYNEYAEKIPGVYISTPSEEIVQELGTGKWALRTSFSSVKAMTGLM